MHLMKLITFIAKKYKMADHREKLVASKLTSVYKTKPKDFDLGCDTDKLVSSESKGAKKDGSLEVNEEDLLSSPSDKKAREAEVRDLCVCGVQDEYSAILVVNVQKDYINVYS